MLLFVVLKYGLINLFKNVLGYLNSICTVIEQNLIEIVLGKIYNSVPYLPIIYLCINYIFYCVPNNNLRYVLTFLCFTDNKLFFSVKYLRRSTKKRKVLLLYKQCCGSGTGFGWIRIQIARLDPDPYSESGSGSCK